jgi:hypothetical protein
VPTLGTRLLLVAHKDVDIEAVRKLMEATYESGFAKVAHPPLDTRLLEPPPEYPWHAGAQLFKERNQPVLSGPLMDSAHKTFAILAAAVSGLFVLWQWRKLCAELARDQGFKKYLRQVTRIEAQATHAERDRSHRVEKLLALREQVCQLKMDALDRFTTGELAGKELLASFLVHANDARDHLTRLIQRFEYDVDNRQSAAHRRECPEAPPLECSIGTEALDLQPR